MAIAGLQGLTLTGRIIQKTEIIKWYFQKMSSFFQCKNEAFCRDVAALTPWGHCPFPTLTEKSLVTDPPILFESQVRMRLVISISPEGGLISHNSAHSALAPEEICRSPDTRKGCDPPGGTSDTLASSGSLHERMDSSFCTPILRALKLIH